MAQEHRAACTAAGPAAEYGLALGLTQNWQLIGSFNKWVRVMYTNELYTGFEIQKCLSIVTFLVVEWIIYSHLPPYNWIPGNHTKLADCSIFMGFISHHPAFN